MLKPIMTEKSMGKVKSANEYTFATGLHATKDQIREEVEKTFDVHVQAVRTKIVRGKEKRVGKARKIIKKTDVKYALVRLKGKDKIELFDIKDEK